MSDRTTPVDVAGAAEALDEAERRRRPIEPLAERFGITDATLAYAVQQALVTRRQAAGETIVGWKVGLTSQAMQTQLGVDRPDYAPILSGQSVAPGSTLERSDFIAPRVEAEIAVRLARPLRGPGVHSADVRDAVAAVAPAIEVIDSRIVDWRIGLPDTISDLASGARVVVGSWVEVGPIDLRLVGVVMERDGEIMATGAGAACLGHPFEAVAWAANLLGSLGVTLPAGAPIMPGALHASVPVAAPAVYRARFDRLGTVEVAFR